jgi:hypothetical protein
MPETLSMKTLFDSVGKTRLLLACLLAGVTLAAYVPVRKYEFVDYDDDRYVTANPRIQQGLSWKNTAWALTATEVANWHPLTWLSHMADCQLYGLNPTGHHLTNLLLHLANVLLLFLVLQQMTGAVWRSWLVAALFAAHPLNIESVAWIAERKNVLSTLFWLLTMWAYLLYARRPGWLRYLLVAGLFVLGLMSKPMLVTLPCVLLLLDYWPLGRLRGRGELSSPDFRRTVFRLALEKAPLFLLAAASSAITIKAQRMDGALNAKTLRLGARLSNALVSYVGGAVGGPLSSSRRLHSRLARNRSSTGACLRHCPGDPLGQKISLPPGGMAMVSGNPRARHWPGPGGAAGDGRPLCVRPIDRPLHHHRVGHGRPDSPPAFQKLLAGRNCCRSFDCSHDGDTLAVEALAEQRHIVRARIGSDSRQRDRA